MCSATRASLLTPPAPAGIAVIQLTGEHALDILNQVFVSKQFQAPAVGAADRLYFGRLMDADEVLDDAVVWCRHEPPGYRIEIQCHGGPRICERVLHRAAQLGAELIPFAQEPPDDDDVLAGASLLQQEVLEGVRLAETPAVARWILRQEKSVTTYVTSIQGLLERGDQDGARGMIANLLARNRAADTLLNGAGIVLVGPPNAGKSTLANALTGKPTSLVSASAGTTRDWVGHPTSICGVPMTVTDTAGLHDAADRIEAEAMKRGLDQVRRADVVILVLDRSVPWPTDLADRIADGIETVTILAANKADLPPAWPPETERSEHERLKNLPVVEVSARTREGIPDLRSHILAVVGLGEWTEHWPALWTNRQRDLGFEALERVRGKPEATAVLLKKLLS